MHLIVDANVPFSCLLRDGLTRRVWFNSSLKLSAPEFIVNEILSYKDELVSRSTLQIEPFDQAFGKLMRKVRLISDSSLIPFMPAAKSLTSDSNDWLYLACALNEGTAIWTHDRHFFNQSRVPIFSTKQLADQLGVF